VHHLGVPFFGQTGNERRNNKKQKKRGALSGSDFQVKKGHCKKRSSNIYIILMPAVGEMYIFLCKNGINCVAAWGG